jgi:hypothetical protein
VGRTVVYRLQQRGGVDVSDNSMRGGVVAIRVNADETLTVDPLPGVEDTALFPGFSAARRTYRR